MPDNRVANHKRQNTGFRRANQVEVDFFSVVPETLSLAELPALSSTSGAVWSGFSSGGLIDYRCSSLLLPVCSHSLRPDVFRDDRCEARFAFPRQAYEVSRVDVVELRQPVLQFVVTASASLQRRTSPLLEPGRIGIQRWRSILEKTMHYLPKDTLAVGRTTLLCLSVNLRVAFASIAGPDRSHAAV